MIRRIIFNYENSFKKYEEEIIEKVQDCVNKASYRICTESIEDRVYITLNEDGEIIEVWETNYIQSNNHYPSDGVRCVFCTRGLWGDMQDEELEIAFRESKEYKELLEKKKEDWRNEIALVEYDEESDEWGSFELTEEEVEEKALDDMHHGDFEFDEAFYKFEDSYTLFDIEYDWAIEEMYRNIEELKRDLKERD